MFPTFRWQSAKSGWYFKTVLCFFIASVFSISAVTAEETPPPAPQKATLSADKRFVDNGDKTVTDTKTGMMWMSEDSYILTGQGLNWHEAKEYIAKLNERGYANYHDWQFPSVEELTTLYDANKLNSAQAGHEMNLHIDPIFAKDGSGSLWSHQENGQYNAFGVVFNDGDRFSSAKTSKAKRGVRAVRQPTR